jgi:ribosomal protein S27AE
MYKITKVTCPYCKNAVSLADFFGEDFDYEVNDDGYEKNMVCVRCGERFNIYDSFIKKIQEYFVDFAEMD